MKHNMAVCIHCNKSMDPRNKASHQITCTDRRDNSIFKCEECTYESGFLSNLTRHKKVHLKEGNCGNCTHTAVMPLIDQVSKSVTFHGWYTLELAQCKI